MSTTFTIEHEPNPGAYNIYSKVNNESMKTTISFLITTIQLFFERLLTCDILMIFNINIDL